MSKSLKNIFYSFPKFIRQVILYIIESLTYLKLKKQKIDKIIKKGHYKKKNILIYHRDCLSFGGTEKNLQMIAKYLDRKKYNVFLMHGTKTENNRASYLNNTGTKIIKFFYDEVGKNWPYFLSNMQPPLEKAVGDCLIDCIVTATPGQTVYPIINIRNIPIILINIFGSFSVQNNIKSHICISEEVKNLAGRVVPEDKLKVQYIPSEKPIINTNKAKQIRQKFEIKDNELVFGRIGRADDSIFDPIGLLAFEIAVKKQPDIHYIIMSPANKAKQLVADRKIPNIHWLEPSYTEEDVWAFHQAINVLAHFRSDGESCGLNIIESMLVGNPILSHKSHIWNAHLEYLDDSFSRVSEKDDYNEYAQNMLEFIDLNKDGKLKQTGQMAKEKAERMFLIENAIKRYEQIIDRAIQ
jgi:glycosyltransferase involved in cell wall biosynthesis